MSGDPSISNALVHLQDALEALTLEVYTASADQIDDRDWQRVPAIQATIAIELERVDCAIGPRGQSTFSPLAERIKEAVIAIVAAQHSLQGEPDHAR